MLKQKFIIDFGAKFGSYLLTAFTGIMIARLAGPEVIGIIAYATAYVTTFSFITGLFGSAHIKLVSEGQDEADCNKTFLMLMFFATLLFSITVLGFFVVQKYFFDYKYDSPDSEKVILLTFVAFVISIIFQINEIFHNARIEQVKSNSPAFFKNIIYNTLRVLVVGLGMGAVALAFVNIISVIISLPFVVFFLKQLKFGKWNKELFKKYIQISLPILIIVITGAIMAYSDKLILEFFSSVKEVGYYSAAYSIGGMLILLGNSAGTIFFPLFSTYISQGNYEAILLKIKAFEQFIFIFILPFVMLLFFFSSPVIITLLGTKYEPAIPIFSLLVLSSFFTIWGMPYGNILSSLGLFWLASLLNFLKFLLFLVTLIVCIAPSLLNLGAMALAITSLVTNAFLFILFYYFSYKKTRIHRLREQLCYLLFWVPSSIILAFVYSEVINKLSVMLQLTLLMPVTIIIIYVLYFIFGLLKKQDIEILRQIISLRSTTSYIKNEIKNYPHN
jgi:O-antigen/teichoic acid export membrane protein